MQTAGALTRALQKQWMRTTRPLQVACVVFPALLFGGVAWIDYRAEVERARENVSMTTDALAEHAQKVIETIELVLARVLDGIAGQDWATLGNSQAMHDFLARLQHELPQVESIFLVDPYGIDVASSRAYPMPRYDVSEREYFTKAVNHSNDKVVVGAPFHGEMAGTLAFTMSRSRIVDGKFDGVVAVTVSPTYFERFYRATLEHPNSSSAALVRADGALLVRFPRTPDRPLQLPPSSSLLQAAASGRDFGLFTARSNVDGPKRVSGFQRLHDPPLLVSYGLDRSVYLATWRMHAAVLAVCAILLSALLLATEHLVRRNATTEHETLRQLLEETERRRQAETMAQQSQKMEAIGRLTGGVAHDFNNLLAIILGSLELALRRQTDPRATRLLQTASEAAQRGAKLTAQMLSFSRKQEITVESVDVNSVVQRMDDLLRRTLGPAVRMHYELAADLWPVQADLIQLELALLNLAVNARDAMPNGGDLTFRTTSVAIADTGDPAFALGPGDYVRVAVIDTGVGMSDEVRSRALEPFYTTKGPSSGTGLGLSMVYGFVTELGGALTLESQLGSGTTVNLYLRKADSAPLVQGPKFEADYSAGQSGRLLLIDDDANVRLSTRTMLEELGHEVVEAASGPEALQVLATDQRFDLLVIDFAMPLMNGSQFATEARKLWFDAPLLFVTGYVENSALRPWSDRGYRTLRKPFSSRELGNAVQSAMKQPQAAAT